MFVCLHSIDAGSIFLGSDECLSSLAEETFLLMSATPMSCPNLF